jgi:hypothetical protein
MVQEPITRPDTEERWQEALRRAHNEGVQVRQLAGCGMWIATSGSDRMTAYEVTPWGCECHAGQYGDPICKHRAALLEKLGRLSIQPVRDASRLVRCATCNGIGTVPGTVNSGRSWRYDNIECMDCHGTGQVVDRRAA